MNAWSWVLVGIAAIIVGGLVAGAPDIARYLRIRRM